MIARPPHFHTHMHAVLPLSTRLDTTAQHRPATQQSSRGRTTACVPMYLRRSRLAQGQRKACGSESQLRCEVILVPRQGGVVTRSPFFQPFTLRVTLQTLIKATKPQARKNLTRNGGNLVNQVAQYIDLLDPTCTQSQWMAIWMLSSTRVLGYACGGLQWWFRRDKAGYSA